MRFLTALLMLALFAAALCGPALLVARRLRARGDHGAYRPLVFVALGQVIVAAALLAASDVAGLTNPAGLVAAIVAGVSVGGAGLFWAWRRARHARR